MKEEYEIVLMKEHYCKNQVVHILNKVIKQLRKGKKVKVTY